MPTTLEFLQAVLPSSGVYCYTVIDKYAKNHFVNSVEELSNQILSWDNKTKGAVYHACASYNSSDSREQYNVRLLRAFWLDVDTGEGKGYVNIQAAIDHLSLFVAHYGLPIPTLVCSGNGLHVYWTLQQEIDRQTWEPYAQALKRVCQEFGLAAGPERTADCASILRPPGSTHRKGLPPKPVICGPLMPHSPLEAFNVLSPVHSTPNNARISLVRNGVRRTTNSHIGDYLNVTSPEAIDFDKLSTECGQFKHFRSSGGNIQEPLWYALLGVLGFCYNGDSIAHSWSCGHPTYKFEETQGRLDRVKELSGPTTCSHIRGFHPSGCEGCKFGGTTPLEAGRRVIIPHVTSTEESISEETETPSMDGSLEGVAVENHPEYQFKAGALYHCTQSLAGGPTEVKLSSFPVCVSSVHVGEINQDQYYYLFRYYKNNNGWHEVVLKPSDVHGPSMMATLANYGMVIHDPTKFHAYIKDSVDSLNRTRRAQMSYEQFGWKNDKFLYGQNLYGPDGPEPAAISAELKFRSQWLCPSPGGSLAGWRQAVDNLMGLGSEGMSLTILASFASVLMPLFGVDDGGAILNLMTRHTGAGKSTALAGAITVWASNKRALGLTNVDTKVSKASSLGFLGNIPCVWDEFDNKDPEIVREFVETFTEGRDKMRGAGGGSIIHTQASWRMLMLIASNSSIQSTIMSMGRSEAPAMRVMELPIESSGTLKLSEAMELERQLNANAGWAGEEFISYLVQPGVKEWVIKKLGELVDDISERGCFQKEHRFWVRSLAAIACAAYIVEKLELISFSTDRIMTWALQHFGDAALGIKADRKSMLEYLSAFLNDKLGETLTMPGPAEGRRLMTAIGEIPKQRVSIRIEAKNEVCYISQQILRQWLEKNAGGGYSDLIREMKKKQILLSDNTHKTLTAGTEKHGGSIACLQFDIGHPAFNGMMREIKETARKEAAVRRLTQ